VFRANTWVAAFATSGVILSASYGLWLYRKVIMGALDKANLKSMFDLSRREIAILVPLVVLTIFFGVYPTPVFNVTGQAVDKLITNYQAALSAAGKLALAAQ
ncbi:MAG TPA: NADH-quinone oxidoreductase subunit M, partial [Kaistia sp.]|nr:NADH-quinone oxidoreductase subunit M [Kaistia sp.]